MSTHDLGEANNLSHWLKNIKDQENVAHVAKEKKQLAVTSAISDEIYELNNPMDEEKTSAWILGFTIYNANPVFQKLKAIHEGRISEFTQRLEKIINKKFTIKKEEFTRINTPEQFEGFSNLLWFINLEFLHSLGHSEEYYLEEHFILQDWLLKILEEFPYSQLTSGQTADETSNKILTFLKTFYRMFKHMSHMPPGLSKTLYQLGDRADRKHFLGVLHKGPVDIVKIVLNSMIIFYATRNMKKWTFLFGHERNFIFHLVKIQVPDFFKGSLNMESNGKLNEITKLNLLPWIQPSGFGDKTHFLEDKVFEKEFHKISHNYLKEISHNEIQNSFKIHPQSCLLMKNEPEKMWDLMVKISSDAKRFDSNMIHAKLDKLVNFDGNLQREKMMKNVGILFKVIWGCNASLIELFGYKGTEKVFLEEQKKLQKDFFNLLSTPQNKSSSSGHQTEEERAHQTLHSEIREFISNSLSDQAKNQISHPNLNLEYIFLQTKKANTVVKVINHFYQSRNYTKWLIVFEDEGKLFQAFEKIGMRLEESKPIRDQTQELTLELTGLFPWDHAFSTTGNQREYIRSLFEE
jgi:hypothetical protein